MASKAKNLSVLIDKQLPNFISSEYPMFSAFLQKYYEQLELAGQPLDIINNLTKYRDIDTYDSNILTENTTLVSITEQNGRIDINVADTSSFPDKNGYVMIEDEIIFYSSKNATTFIDCFRNVSATTKIGDLYSASEFKTVPYDQVGISTKQYAAGTLVSNISNLFLYALVKNFEKEYLGSFPENVLKKDVNKTLLIKNIKKFYSTKGTDQSIRFIFNSIVSRDPSDIPTVYYPKDNVYKPSSGEWIDKYALKVKVLSGDITKILGEKIVQESSEDKKYAFAVVDNIQDAGDGFYEIILAEDTVVGEFSVLAKTNLTKDLLPSDANINVFSTLGWKSSFGSVVIGNEVINFKSKNVRQFTIDQRSPNPLSYPAGTEVLENTTVTAKYVDENGSTQTVRIFVYGVLYSIKPQVAHPFSKEGDVIQISESGAEPTDRIVFDSINNRIRWIINQNNEDPTSPSSLIQNRLDEVLCNVSAIFEDSEYFYITSSGYPDYSIGKSSWSQILQDQKHLKLIRKNPSKTTEIYETKPTDVGIFLNGVTARSYKDQDSELVVYGEITDISVTNQGSGYKNPPFVLVQDGAGEIVATAKAIMNGEVVEKIAVIDSGAGFFPPVPVVTITSGRNAVVEPVVTRDKITALKIINPGEYYSSPPNVIIKDTKGGGRFAKFEAIVSDDGKLIGFNKIDEGKFYTQENTVVEIQAVGSGATATSIVRSWRKDLFKKYFSDLDNNNGYYFPNPDSTLGYGYSCLANPKSLRVRLSDNLDSQGNVPAVLTHSPIIGYAYDGNPIYGPYGYSNPTDKNSSISRMTSSYSLNFDRPLGPPLSQYPLGSFVEDYSYIHRSGSLDENNGRFCVTPEYPEGTYAYFITIDSSNNPVFPYIVGKNYYSIPVDSNYTKAISQKDLPVNILRVRTGDSFDNGQGSFASISSVSTGSLSDAVVEDSPENFSVGCLVETDYSNNSGSGVLSKVSSVKGKSVVSVEAKKSLQITTENNVYLFNGDIVTQASTNATGEVVGNIFDSKNIVLRNISGTFNKTNTISSNIKVVSLFVDKSSSYTLDNDLILTNGKQEGITRIIGNKLYVGVNPFVNGESVRFSSSAHGLNSDVLYYVVNSESTYFEVSAILDGAPVLLTDTNSPGIVATSEKARGTILETTSLSNIVKVKVTKGLFEVDNEYYLRSLNLGDTIGSKIVTISNLSSGIVPFAINNNIAIVRTANDHQLAIGDKVNVDINPSDSLTETTYYVRSKIYQKLKLEAPVNNKTIKDTGIGNLVVLNNGSYIDPSGVPTGDYAFSTGGNSSFQNVELIFADVTKCRDGEGRIVGNSSLAEIGRPGNANNAKATVTVTNGIVSNVNITFKGVGYKKGDILTVAPAKLDRFSQSTSTRFLLLEVDHVGLGKLQTRIFLNDTSGISNNDFLQINEEIVKVTLVNEANSYVDVLREQLNTVAAQHFNNQLVSTYKSKYNLSVNYRLGNSESDPVVYSYNPDNQELVLVYDLGQNLSTINTINSGDSFFDQSTPKKIVNVKDNIDPAAFKFEFSTNSSESSTLWQRNPNLKLQKFYKYKFDTSHYTLRGSHLEFSPSGNFNIITTESIKNNISAGNAGSFTTLKFGFGDAIASNTYSEKKTLYYNTYFYFDKNNIIDSDNNYLTIVEDPLQGEKTVTYVTPNRFVYNMDEVPLYDGTGSLAYTTKSNSAVGKIDSIKVINGGVGFDNLPAIIGVVPTSDNECVVDVNWNSLAKNVISVNILSPGKNYIRPKAVLVSSSGKGAEFEVSTYPDGSISGIITKNRGSGYLTKPTMRIVETYVSAYYTSNNIGVPKSINLVFNGKNYNSDFSTRKTYKGATILTLKNIRNDFIDGEVVEQYDGNILVAKAVVANNGWSKNTNILRVVNTQGEFKNGLSLYGKSRGGNAVVTASFVSLFESNVKSFYDNLGYYVSDKGKLSSSYQKLADNYFYQDYSYVIKSKTPIERWRDVIKETVHPAGFKVFGELTIESSASSKLPETQPKTNQVSRIQLWDPQKNKITVQNTFRKVTTSTVSLFTGNTERGRGSLCQLSYDTGETNAYEFKLVPEFNGYFDDNGNRSGNKTFTITLVSNNKPYAVPKAENIIMTLDGIVQEPGKAFTVSDTQITFAEPPLGYRDIDGNSISKQNYKEGVDTPAQKIVGRIIRFKESSLNNTYFRKIQNISSQFDGVKTSFKLYYTNNDPVNVPSKENLLVYIDGVIQKAGITPTIPVDRSYYIRRTVIPNEIVFMDPPKSGQSFSATSVGAYERLTLNYDYVDNIKYGPFPLKSLFFERRISIDDDKNILVFIDGILQRRRKNYSISNTSITFTEAVKKDQRVDILYLFGREMSKAVLAFNTENQPFLNRYNIIIGREVRYVDSGFRAKSNSVEGIVRGISYVYNTSRQITQTVITVDTQNRRFTTTENIRFTLGNEIVDVAAADITYVVPFTENEDLQGVVQRSRSGWLSNKAIKYNYKNSVNPGDFIKIDGEDEYREVLYVPEYGIKTDYRLSDEVNSSYYSRWSVTNYNFSQRGEGLDITPSVQDGKVVSLDWGKVDWQQYVGTNNHPTPAGYGYENYIQLEFVAQPVRDESGEITASAQGGGAKAYAVIKDGIVIDVVLYDQGSDYLTAPKVYVTRGYQILRKRKSINTHQIKLSLTPVVLTSSTLRVSTSYDIIRPLDLQVVTVVSSAQGGSLLKVSPDIHLKIQKEVDTSDIKTITAIASTINLSTNVSSYNTVYTYQKYRTIQVDTQNTITSTSTILQNTIVTGVVDKLRLGISDRYTQNVLGQRLRTFTEGFRYMDVGYANVSAFTIGDFSGYYPNVTVENFDGELDTNYVENSELPWNITYPSIQEHGAILDQSISSTSNIVYIPNTSRFPESGCLLIGDEIVTYSSKLSDRFLGVARGQAGTTAKPHAAGDYLRTLVNDRVTSWTWNGSGSLFEFNEASVAWVDEP